MQAWFDPIHDLPPDHPELHLRYREAASEYAGECALLKFHGTEVQYLCADEGVQIHGGYGYTEDFPIAKIFRESRVPRIYEGTNEINRLNFTQHVIRQMQRAGLPLLGGGACAGIRADRRAADRYARRCSTRWWCSSARRRLWRSSGRGRRMATTCASSVKKSPPRLRRWRSTCTGWKASWRGCRNCRACMPKRAS
jgi:hypothetical protein